MEGRRSWQAPFALGKADELDYAGALRVATDTGFFGSTDDPLLETVVEMLDELGRPDEAYRCLQVAGTNGKTSTSRYASAALAAAGMRVALYTSPELVSMTERMEVGGRPVSEVQFAHGVSYAATAGRRVNARREAAGLRPYRVTEFDLLTCAACVVFAEAGVDVAVLEVGLGGRWDATSAVARTCAATVTGIGLDHMKILGDTLEKIACEKAAVIRPGNPCVLGTNAVRPAGVLAVMLARCAEVGARPTVVAKAGEPVLPAAEGLPRCTYEVTHAPSHLGDALTLDVDVQVWVLARGAASGLREEALLAAGEGAAHADSAADSQGGVAGARVGSGRDGGSREGRLVSARYEGVSLVAPIYQAQNVACALALATAVAGGSIPVDSVRAAIAACPTPGRFEVVRAEPLALIDACHNPQSAEAFRAALVQVEPDRAARPTLVFATLADKDHRGIVRVVAPLFDRIVVTQSDSERALPAERLGDEVREEVAARAAGGDAQGWDPQVSVAPTLADALARLEGQPFVCCGTITVVGELKGMLAR